MRQADAMNAAAPRRPLPERTTLITELTAVWALAAAVTVIWAVTGRGYFWPMWVYLAIAIVLSVHLGVVWAWAQPEGRRRQLAMHGVLTAILVAIQVAVWAMTGAGLFWPIFSLVALGGLFAIHAAVRSAPGARARGPRGRADPHPPRRARRPGAPSCAGSSATCTTARRRGWSR